MTMQEVINLIEKDFPDFEWLVRANSNNNGKYFSNATEHGAVLPLLRKGDPLPRYAAFAEHPDIALFKTYMLLRG